VIAQQQLEKTERGDGSSLLGSASADEFLPLLIYIILKANPPNLASNIQYISRFHTVASTRFSELNYYFISLVGAGAIVILSFKKR